MAGIGALISSLLSSAAKLLAEVQNSFIAPSSSSLAQSLNASVVEDDVNKLVRTLKRIKATLYDADEREIRDRSVKLWLKELKEVAYAAEYIIDEYMYEVYRSKVEAKNAYGLNSHMIKQEEGSDIASCAHFIKVPDGFVDSIRDIRSRFDEIAKDREALRLHEDDARRCNGIKFRPSSSHLISESNVFGRKLDKVRVIDLLFSNNNEGIIAVVPIVGKGGLGKTTLAQLVYNDQRVKQNFDIFGWTCVTENFSIERLMQELIESFTRDCCSIKNLSILQEKLKEIVVGKKVFVVLDDVWNEDKNLWALFRAPFMYALRGAFVVTTRSDRVAKIMQTNLPFQLGYLSEKESWALFQQNAFDDNEDNLDANLLDLGRNITKKCGGLPLALKSISNLLRNENEESWREILENDLWEIYAENEIFGALQISYTHMPAYLKPCFLYCSLFPKDYVYEENVLIPLWIAEGYIEPKGKKLLEEIAHGYLIELKERSFIDPIYLNTISWFEFKMHDLIHDLARLNSGNEFYSIKGCKQPNLPSEVLHLYMDDRDGLLGQLSFNKIATLRTLLLRSTSYCIDLSGAKCLRTLRLYGYYSWGSRDNQILVSFGFLKHLRFLCLSECNVERMAESLCLLYNLRTLIMNDCIVVRFPENISNLVHLQKLVIGSCEQLCSLPESLGNLSGLTTLNLNMCPKIKILPNGIGNLINLKNLTITNIGINSLPCSFGKFKIFDQLNINIDLRLDGHLDTIRWLKDFDNLKGTLSIVHVERIQSLEDARDFNLVSKPYMEKLLLTWNFYPIMFEMNKLEIVIKIDDDYWEKTKSMRQLLGKDKDLRLLERLQPHPNLKNLEIDGYPSVVFPGWMGDSLSCASLEKLYLVDCLNITNLLFRNLRSLKHLKINNLYRLQTISQESLPSQLQSLVICSCFSLQSISVQDIESLVEVEIEYCNNLEHFPWVLISEESCEKISSKRRKLKIDWCHKLRLGANEVLPYTKCNIEISDCAGLKEWCLRHNIGYR